MASASAPRLSPILIVYLLVVIYALCYQLQSPLEPFLVEKLVNSESAATEYAKLQGFFSLVQLVGSFAMGFLIDRVGLRAMFALNFLACALCYAILANTTTIELLYVSKLPAVFQAGFLCAQTAAAKLTAPGAERASALGRLTSSYTIGATVGPTLGGFLGVTASAWLAVVGSIVAIFLVCLLPVPEEEVAPKAAPAGSPASIARKAAAAKMPNGTATGNGRSALSRVGEALSSTWPLVLSKMTSGFVNSAHGALLMRRVVLRTWSSSLERTGSQLTCASSHRVRAFLFTGSVRPLILKDTFGLDAKRLGGFMSAMLCVACPFFGSACVSAALCDASYCLCLGRNNSTKGGQCTAEQLA